MNRDEMMYAARCEYLDRIEATVRAALDNNEITEDDIRDFIEWNFKELTESEIDFIVLTLILDLN